MQKTTLPNSEPIHHLDGVPARLVGRLLLGGALALLTGPSLTLAAQQPQNTQASATGQKAVPQNPANRNAADQTPAKSPHASASHRHPRQHAQKEAPAKPVQEAAAAPPAPPPPDWPANHQPNPATVVWDSRGLQIQASNSSLDQILRDVATDTGAKLDGLGQGTGSNQRIFGTYGPGPARDVISKLLDGSGYNVLMIGGTGDQPPQQIILSKSAAGTPPPANTAAQPSEQQEEPDVPTEQNVEQDYRPPEYPMPPRNPFGGPAPRTPQEVQQQIQQRQQQLEQLRQQQQQQQQQPPPQ